VPALPRKRSRAVDPGEQPGSEPTPEPPEVMPATPEPQRAVPKRKGDTLGWPSQ
jgi:hypothetical protein